MTGNNQKMGAVLKAFDEIKSALAASIARVLVNPEDVDDILQETYLQVHDQAERGDIRSLKDYFFRVARNAALKKKAEKYRTTISSIEDMAGFEPHSDQTETDISVHYSQKLEAFIEIANSLPPKCKQAFLLKKVAGLSQKQIARKMGIAESTVEKHLITAMHRTVSEMNKRGYSVKSKHSKASPKTSETGYYVRKK